MLSNDDLLFRCAAASENQAAEVPHLISEDEAEKPQQDPMAGPTDTPRSNLSPPRFGVISRKRQEILTLKRAPILIPGREEQISTLHQVLGDTAAPERSEIALSEGSNQGRIDPSGLHDTRLRFVLIQGKSGVGKSCLARTLRDPVEARGGYFIEARFDPKRALIPFSAMVSVILDWIRQVLARGPEAVSSARSLFLANVEQDDINMLLKAIPCVSLILMSDEMFGDVLLSVSQKATVHALRGGSGEETNEHRSALLRQLDSSYVVVERFPFVFGTIMRGMGSTDKPVVVVYDDFQHADADSIMLLERTAIDVTTGGIVFVAPFQTAADDVSTGTENFDSTQVQKRFSQFALTSVISLDDLDIKDTMHFISEVLHPEMPDASVEMRDHLALRVHQLCNGNISRLWNVLSWLEATPETRCHESDGSSFWSSPALVETLAAPEEYSTNREVFATLRNHVLDDGLADLLKVSACLGHMIDIMVVKCALPTRNVPSLLGEACDDGIFVLPLGSGFAEGGDVVATSYGFVDDSLPRAIYNHIPGDERCSIHVELGRRAWRQVGDQDIDTYVFLILSQLVLGRGKISREHERLAVASLSLHGGRLAAKMSSFRVAHTYFAFGLGRLESSNWQNNYDLLLALTNAAAEMCMCTGQYNQMEEYLEDVLRHARTFRDKVQAFATRISSFSIRDKQNDAVNLGIEVLSALGETFPRNFRSACLLRELWQVRRLLRGRSDQQLFRLPLIANESKLLALQIFIYPFCQRS
jgi:predicted ATPase